ncbi:MAG: hypothetical protein ACE5GX_06600 [Thermoanaerobaculia bacterium]
MTPSDPATADAELIAAFIDGRLPEDEREAFLQRLDEEPALYEVFAETVRCRDELAASSAEVVEHPRSRQSSYWRVAIAAGLVLVIGIPVLMRSLSEESYGEMLADGRLDPYLTEGWYEQPWSEMRGPTPGRRDADTAFRIGVRVVDLEVALRAGRMEDAGVLTHRLEARLGGIELTEPLRASYAELGRRLDEGIGQEEALELAGSVATLTGEYLPDLQSAYRLGVWVESGALAARSDNEELLRSSWFRRELRSLRDEQFPRGFGEELEAIAQLTAGSMTEADLEALEETFSAILGAH